MGLFKFLASPTGRVGRIVAGLIIVAVGVWFVWPTSAAGGLIVAIIGLAPLLAGLLDVCLFAPLFGLAWRGAEIREKT